MAGNNLCDLRSRLGAAEEKPLEFVTAFCCQARELLFRFDAFGGRRKAYLPFAQSGGQLLFHLVSRLYERTSIVVTTTWPSANDGTAR